MAKRMWGSPVSEARKEVGWWRSGSTKLKHDAVGTYLLLSVLPQFHELFGVLL